MSEHNLNLAFDYYKIFGEKNYLHIRSTALFNIGKYIFPAGSLKIINWQVKDIAKYVKKWTKIEDETKNIAHLEHLLDHAQLDNFYNYNPLELLFVSYRLIQWHSGVVGESDISFNTMLLLNARKIVELLLSYPVEERFENKLFIELVEELWPVLNYWDINSTQTLKTKYDSINDDLNIIKESTRKMFRSLITTSSTQSLDVDICNAGYGYLLKFSELEISENDNYKLLLDFSNFDKEDEIEFKVEFFYNNQKGRDRIFVNTNTKFLNGDILNYYGINIVNVKIKDLEADKKLNIQITHRNSTQTKSWVEASRMWIGEFKLNKTMD
jgi:hypothetical protein